MDETDNLHQAPFRVLIVDDHARLRAELVSIVAAQHDLTVCGEAANVAEAIGEIETKQPHVVVADFSLGGEHGFDIIRHIRHGELPIRLLICSTHAPSVLSDVALEHGADAYVSKPHAQDDLLPAIRRVLSGACLDIHGP